MNKSKKLFLNDLRRYRRAWPLLTHLRTAYTWSQQLVGCDGYNKIKIKVPLWERREWAREKAKHSEDRGKGTDSIERRLDSEGRSWRQTETQSLCSWVSAYGFVPSDTHLTTESVNCDRAKLKTGAKYTPYFKYERRALSQYLSQMLVSQ